MIDPNAIIDSNAKLASNVTIGPYSIIGPDIEIGEGSWIGSHVVIKGPTKIGKNNKIYQFASVGEAPQDKKYAGEPTILEIGDNNVIREQVTINRGTAQGGGITRIGDDNLIMVGAHIAHDCSVGDNTIFANNASLAGHVTIEDYVILGGFSLIYQFSTIGAHSFTAMGSVINKDVPPYLLVSGHMARPHGLNVEGLKRRGFSADAIRALRKAYKIVYKSGNQLQDALEELQALEKRCAEVGLFRTFIENSSHGIIR